MEAVAKLNNCPMSPRKMRLVADQIRGEKVGQALNILKFNQKPVYAIKIEKLLKSAIANWSQANDGASPDPESLFVKEIYVGQGRSIKRLRPAPQGRAHRIRKRSNHITLIVDQKGTEENNVEQDNE